MPRESAERAFAEAAAMGALFELRLRLTAGSVPAVAKSKLKLNLSEVRDLLLSHYGEVVPDGGADLLIAACQLRNKLLHCDFSRMRIKLGPGGADQRDGGVVKLDAAGLDGAEMLAKLDAHGRGEDVGEVRVGDTVSNRHDDIFGWLLESAGAGDFADAARVFKNAMDLLDQIDPHCSNKTKAEP